jgi:hypothetical protein
MKRYLSCHLSHILNCRPIFELFIIYNVHPSYRGFLQTKEGMFAEGNLTWRGGNKREEDNHYCPRGGALQY